jgi:glycosyltransferase involved in cell wall biosynthesis
MVTAGAGGMYCGSCLQDNALVAALIKAAVDIQLLPMYTPIRTDEPNQSLNQVFFGGINVYLQQKFPPWGKLPMFLTRWLDHPQLIRWVTSVQMQTNASRLGDLTVSMLKGSHGNQAAEVERLVEWLDKHAHPQLVHFSNILICGCAPTIKQRLDIPVLVTLQGDDVFLGDLGTPHQQAALDQIREIDRSVDAYVVHSDFYADHMASYLGIDRTKFRKIPLSITTADLAGPVAPHAASRPPTIGYMARLAPEKGLPGLCAALELLRRRPATANVRLVIAGWLGADYQTEVEDLFQQLAAACGPDSFEFRGTVTRSEKRQLFSDIDVLSVPTTFLEPKGLYVLESLASGTPVVQPNHGVFPELLESTGGGLLCQPNDPEDLADRLSELLTDESRRRELGATGQANVRKFHTATVAAAALQQIYRSHC